MKECEDGRMGQGEKWIFSEVATEASSYPTRSSGAEITL